ncbi:MAG TPA: YIP1 family protein [Gemmatimonadales bacterium]|nr:YIP1 family protein [Gemmatimonadales bacterium]
MDALLDLLRVLYEPTAVFQRVRERPRFLVPAAAITVLALVMGLLSLPFIKAAIAPLIAQAAAARGVPPDPEKAALVQVVATAALTPLFIGFGAGVLWIAVSLFGIEAQYRVLASVAAYTSIMYALQLIAGFAVLSVRGVETITSPLDLQPAFGLDLFAPGTTGYLGALLRGINVFSVWGGVLNGMGIAVTHRTTPRTGYAAAALALVVTVLLVSTLALLQPASPR